MLTENSEHVLEVSDSGIGLPDDEIRQRLTEPYVTTRAKGTGLGLAIVWKIIEDHRGRLTLDDAQDGGAKVTFHFPAAAPASKENRAPPQRGSEIPKTLVDAEPRSVAKGA